jgi:formate dehydrogenase subunit gamma
LFETWDQTRAESISSAFDSVEGSLLPVLHAFQATFGCVPQEATAFLAQKLNLSRAEVHGVISFYHDFRAKPPGKLVVKVCRAEACQSMGARGAAEALLQHLRLAWGETTADGAVTVEPVYCLGLCAVAPAALIDGAPRGHLSASLLIDAVEAAR